MQVQTDSEEMGGRISRSGHRPEYLVSGAQCGVRPGQVRQSMASVFGARAVTKTSAQQVALWSPRPGEAFALAASFSPWC